MLRRPTQPAWNRPPAPSKVMRGIWLRRAKSRLAVERSGQGMGLRLLSCTEPPAEQPERAPTKNIGLGQKAGLAKPWMELVAAAISLYALVVVAVPHKSLADLRASLQTQAATLAESRDKQRKVEVEIELAQMELGVSRTKFQGDLAALRMAEQELEALNQQASQAEQRSNGLSHAFAQASTRMQQSQLQIDEISAETQKLEIVRQTSYARLLTIQLMRHFNRVFWDAELSQLKTPVSPGLLTAVLREMVRDSRQELAIVFGESRQQAFAGAADRASAALEKATLQAEEIRRGQDLSEEELTEQMERSGISASALARIKAGWQIEAILRTALANAMRDCFSAILTPAQLAVVFGPPQEPT